MAQAAVDGTYPANAAGDYYFPAPLDPDDQGARGVDYYFRWGAWLDGNGTGVQLTGVPVVTPVDGGLSIQDIAIVSSGRDVQFWAQVSSGKPGEDQRVRCQIVDSEGRPQTRTGIMRVLHR